LAKNNRQLIVIVIAKIPN